VQFFSQAKSKIDENSQYDLLCDDKINVNVAWLSVAMTNKRLILMTQESVTLKKIPGKEKPTDGQKNSSFKHILSILLCFMTLNDGIIEHSLLNVAQQRSHTLFEN